MGQSEPPASKSPASHLHVVNLVVALLAGVISITGGIYSLKNNVFSGPAYGSLQGIVRDERIAKPLKLASVEISDLAGAVVNTASTDDEGHYLIESLKTGNYVVKFTAPIHKVQSKTIKIEKNLTSSINVDLFPEVQRANPSPGEYVASVPRNVQAPYTPAATYPAATPVVPGYVPQPSSSSSSYGQKKPVNDLPFSQPRPSGYRRHPRHNDPGEPVEATSGTSQSTSQGGALAETGAQLLQAWLSSKSDSSSGTSTTATS